MLWWTWWTRPVRGSEVYMDNLLTFINLLSKMSARGIGCTNSDTMQQNHLKKVPLPKKELSHSESFVHPKPGTDKFGIMSQLDLHI